MKRNSFFGIIQLLSLLILFNSVVRGQVPELWGMTSLGGKQRNTGVIFKTDINGENQIIEHSFFAYDGTYPQYTHLVEDSSGYLYGLTSSGGLNSNGVLFKYNFQTEIFLNEVNFDDISTGSQPYGSLVKIDNGKFYGMTYVGGDYNKGVLFEYNPITKVYSKKIDFMGFINGNNPTGSLIQATNGKLYGLIQRGGTNNKGVLFEYDPSTEIFTKKLDFDGVNTGSRPYGTLIQSDSGKLYGMTREGGINDMGILFEYDPTNNLFIKKRDFNFSDGFHPIGSLLQANNKLYGMTEEGGANNKGVLFEYDITTNIYTKKIDFDGTNKGSYAVGSLIQATNGRIYGMTYKGGANDFGVLFEYDIDSELYVKKLDFDGLNGKRPGGSLIQASDGKLYGLTQMGGLYDDGVLFQYNLDSNVYTKKLEFNRPYLGRWPKGSLMQANNGLLYGMTFSGGEYFDFGVLFEYNPISRTYSKKIEFDGVNKGKWPIGSLVQATNGKLYGMTWDGGNYGKGVLFEYDFSTNNFSKKVDFDGANKGFLPVGSLIEPVSGDFYGVTGAGGSNNMGVIFTYNSATDVFTKKIDFDGVNIGKEPSGTLLQASNNKIYGLTGAGGVNNLGVLFEYNPITNILTKKLDFDGINKGKWPKGYLVQANNGKLYGITGGGGANNKGVLFEYDPSTEIFTKKIDFDGINGENPNGALMLGSNGNLYGMTRLGGLNAVGVLFEYNIQNNELIKKLDFNGSNGKTPEYSHLIETNICYPSHNINDTIACDEYLWNDSIYNVSGTFIYDYINSCGSLSIDTLNLALNYSSDIDTTINDINLPVLYANMSGVSYQWIDCDNNFSPIVGENQQSFYVSSNGNYAVELSMGQCKVTSPCYSVIGINIEQQDVKKKVTIYPNPISTTATLNDGAIFSNIRLIDLSGRIISFFPDSQLRLDFSNIPNGIYFLELKEKEFIKRIKLVINHN